MANMPLSPEIMELLARAPFPITTDELADFAKANGASEETLAQIRFTPDHIFSCIEDVVLTLGLLDEFEGAENLWPAAANDDLLSPEEAAVHISETEGDSAAP